MTNQNPLPHSPSRVITAILLVWAATASGSANAQVVSLEQELLAERIEDLAADAREKGDAMHGAFLFHSYALGCAKCHDDSQTPNLGPDLSNWQKTVDDRHLVESVLRPSTKIDDRYRSVVIVTFGGKSLSGIEQRRDDKTITLQTGIAKTEILTVAMEDVEFEKRSDISIMPQGQVNALRRRQEFLDLIAYLIAIRDGGREAVEQLRPSEESLRLKIPSYESNVDHRGIIEDWNKDSLSRGQAIYEGLCVNCHGTIKKPGSLPTSLRFAEGKFKFGNDPHSIYQTLTHGGGLMMPLNLDGAATEIRRRSLSTRTFLA